MTGRGGGWGGMQNPAGLGRGFWGIYGRRVKVSTQPSDHVKVRVLPLTLKVAVSVSPSMVMVRRLPDVDQRPVSV